MSQLLTNPAALIEITMPSFACRLMDEIGVKTGGENSEPVAAGPVDEEPNCQTLTDLSSDDEIREGENVMDLMGPACPVKLSTR